jgi:HSP20 family protein
MSRDDRDDRDDPFEDLFRQLERMMNDMMGEGSVDRVDVDADHPAGFGSDTHVDIHETNDDIRVVADLPGVEQDGIDLKCDGESLTIAARSEYRDYEEYVTLPARVDEHSATATYNNGVLEVVFDRVEGSANIDVD